MKLLGFCFLFAVLAAIGFGFIGSGIGAIIGGQALAITVGKYASLAGVLAGAFYFGPRYYKRNYPNLNNR